MNKNILKSVEALNERDISQMSLVYKDEFLNDLNHEQRVAATRQEGDFLVIAGPGSGKTHTLAYRVVYLVKHQVDPKSIVVITFTRKAGNQLKSRIQALLPNTSLGFIGTFHAFSHHLSQKIGNASPISGFRLLDSEDDIQVHKLVMADHPPFTKKITASRLQKIISYCNNTKLSVGEYIDTYDLKDLTEDIEGISNYRQAYERYKGLHLLANYDDMIQLVSKYLEKDGEKVTSSFNYLMIDEYQDTNKMQLDFIKRLKIKNTMAIGDDFQGIYGFRGADHRIILNFIKDFEYAKMIKLKENYRSTKNIVNYVNKTVERSALGFKKEFHGVKEEKGETRIISGESLDTHKALILNHIKEKPNDTHALIYRFNKNRTVFEKAFIEENIDYTVYGGIRLLERKHIKDVLAFLMLYLNRLDVVSYNRVLTLFPGIGHKTSRKIIDTNLNDLSFVSGKKKEYLLKLKELLMFKGSKEKLYSDICQLYFEIFESVENTYYTKDEINDDFKLVYDLLKSYNSLHNFIINLILDPVVDFNKGKKPKVVLTTIHSAKGLEFDNVYYFHTHDWYKNYDLENLEEDRRLFYVGISRAKENLYIFDHAGYPRVFEEILHDFDHISMQYEETQSNDANIPIISKTNEPTKEIKMDQVYECIQGQAYDNIIESEVHQDIVYNLFSELKIHFRRTSKKPKLEAILDLEVRDELNKVQPDLVIYDDNTVEVIIEVISEQTRTKDMVSKMNLYMQCAIREYWIVDSTSKMVMIYAFDNGNIISTKIYLIGQSLMSVIDGNLMIDLKDIFIEI